MKRHRLTQVELAHPLGIASTVVSQVVTGTKSWPRNWTPVLAELLGENWLRD